VETEIRDGELIVSCYSRPELWPAGAVQRLALALPEGLHAVLRHCCDKSHRRWTPSDFPQLALTQRQVDRLPATVESACALTDMQWTMLRHQHIYQVHMCYRIPRAFDETACGEAVALPAGPLAGMADVVAQQRRLRADADWCAYFAGLPWAPTACQLPARTQLKAAADAATMPDRRLHLGTLEPELIAAVRAAA